MKSKIKQLLKESINKNSLGVEVTRPNQELIILRGIPGSGKSSKASSFGSNAKIHITEQEAQPSLVVGRNVPNNILLNKQIYF